MFFISHRVPLLNDQNTCILIMNTSTESNALHEQKVSSLHIPEFFYTHKGYTVIVSH